MRRILHLMVLVTGIVAVSATPSAAGGGGCHGAQTEGEGTTVEMTGMCFSPTVLRVEPGTEVTFVNRDPLAHVVLGVGWGDWEDLGTGERVTHRFDAVGAFPYTCNLHPGMNGVVLVGHTEAVADSAAPESSGASSAVVPAVAGIAVVGAYLLGRRQRALANVPR